MNIEKTIFFIRQNIEIGGYNIAAKECMQLIEHSLRQLFLRHLTKLEEKDRYKVQEVELEIGKGKSKGIESFTMGELVRLFRQAKFLDAWSKASGRDLSNIRVINLDQMTELRNKLVHRGDQVDRSDAEFLLYCLKMIVETFGIESLEEGMKAEHKTRLEHNAPAYSDKKGLFVEKPPAEKTKNRRRRNGLLLSAVSVLILVFAGALYFFTIQKNRTVDHGRKPIARSASSEREPVDSETESPEPTPSVTTAPTAAIPRTTSKSPEPSQTTASVRPASETPGERSFPVEESKPASPEPSGIRSPKIAISIKVSADNTNETVMVNQFYNFLKKKHGNLILKQLTNQAFQEGFNGDTSQIDSSDSSALILGRLNATFSHKSALDQEIISCDLVFDFRTMDAGGNTVNADSYRIVGAGFSESDAVKNAMEKIASNHSDEIFTF